MPCRAELFGALGGQVPSGGCSQLGGVQQSAASSQSTAACCLGPDSLPGCSRSSTWVLHRGDFHTEFLLFPQLDVAIDGADEVDSDLNLIKGGG